jgi:hypothetical protein
MDAFKFLGKEYIPFAILLKSSLRDLPKNGVDPVNNSYVITPKDHKSTEVLYFFYQNLYN